MRHALSTSDFLQNSSQPLAEGFLPDAGPDSMPRILFNPFFEASLPAKHPTHGISATGKPFGPFSRSWLAENVVGKSSDISLNVEVSSARCHSTWLATSASAPRGYSLLSRPSPMRSREKDSSGHWPTSRIANAKSYDCLSTSILPSKSPTG